MTCSYDPLQCRLMVEDIDLAAQPRTPDSFTDLNKSQRERLSERLGRDVWELPELQPYYRAHIWVEESYALNSVPADVMLKLSAVQAACVALQWLTCDLIDALVRDGVSA